MKHKNIAAAAISAVLGLMSLALSAKESYIGTDSTVVVRDYIANMEYVNGVLERVNFEGGYIDMTGDSPRYMYYVTDHLGNVRTVVDEDGNVCQENHYYPYGDRFEDTREIPVEESDNTKLFGGKEYSEDTGLHDFEARYADTRFGRFTTLDPMAEKYYSVSPYSYCAGNPVCRVDPDGLAWRLTTTSDIGSISRYGNGYEWVEESESYDEEGNLLPGLYHQAIFFSDNGTFNPKSSYNIGSSTAYIYLADGSIVTYAACTHPSNLSKYPTINEGSYEANVGMHKGSYAALKMRDVGAKMNRIELGFTNPAYGDGRTYAEGIDIHRAGDKNYTGVDSNYSPVSAGCLLVDRNEWEQFIGHFIVASQVKNTVGVYVSRSMSSPVNFNVVKSELIPLPRIEGRATMF